MNTFLIICAIFILGLVAGLCINFYDRDDEDDADFADAVAEAANQDATALLNHLESSECDLFYNSTINAWGLVDGQDNLIAAGHSIRATLRRAQACDLAQRVANDFTNAELAQVQRAQAARNTVAKG